MCDTCSRLFDEFWERREALGVNRDHRCGRALRAGQGGEKLAQGLDLQWVDQLGTTRLCQGSPSNPLLVVAEAGAV